MKKTIIVMFALLSFVSAGSAANCPDLTVYDMGMKFPIMLFVDDGVVTANHPMDYDTLMLDLTLYTSRDESILVLGQIKLLAGEKLRVDLKANNWVWLDTKSKKKNVWSKNIKIVKALVTGVYGVRLKSCMKAKFDYTVEKVFPAK